ncbi:MAG TPA: hypothetical protein VNO32_16290, partial [Candidatus Acidoferrum sp.]|nr:hypothetical protein [Candidatus Acidoferrum sp.]
SQPAISPTTIHASNPMTSLLARFSREFLLCCDRPKYTRTPFHLQRPEIVAPGETEIQRLLFS